MAREPRDLEGDETVVLVDPVPDGDMDVWFASLMRNEPTELPLTAADLVAGARAEAE
jgi:hypothetical protein